MFFHPNPFSGTYFKYALEEIGREIAPWMSNPAASPEWDRFQHGELARNELWEFLSLIILLIWCEHREVTV